MVFYKPAKMFLVIPRSKQMTGQFFNIDLAVAEIIVKWLVVGKVKSLLL